MGPERWARMVGMTGMTQIMQYACQEFCRYSESATVGNSSEKWALSIVTAWRVCREIGRRDSYRLHCNNSVVACKSSWQEVGEFPRWRQTWVTRDCRKCRLGWPLFNFLSQSFAPRIFSDAIWHVAFKYRIGLSNFGKIAVAGRLNVYFGQFWQFSS